MWLVVSILDKWKNSVDKLNTGKYGRPFEFPDELIYWAALQHVVMGMPYRQIQGYLQQYFQDCNIKVPDYTTLFKRIKAMKFDLEIRAKKTIVLAVDSSGFKVSNRGEWRRKHRGRKRHGWIKLHVAIDKYSKQVLSFKITGEHAHDSELFIPLLKQVDQRLGPGRIKKVLGDRGYDSKQNFNYMEKRGITPTIRPRTNANPEEKQPLTRKRAVKTIRRHGYQKWGRQAGYGLCWEWKIFFSSFKRFYGEFLRATGPQGMLNELIMKLHFYISDTAPTRFLPTLC